MADIKDFVSGSGVSDRAFPSSRHLKTSFEEISSGVRVGTATGEGTGDCFDDCSPYSEGVDKILAKLGDVVSVSSRALESLEGDVGGGGKLGEIRDYIDGVVGELRDQFSKTEVVKENYKASKVRLEDLSCAQRHANKAVARFDAKALEAHVGLSADKVVSLLG